MVTVLSNVPILLPFLYCLTIIIALEFFYFTLEAQTSKANKQMGDFALSEAIAEKKDVKTIFGVQRYRMKTNPRGICLIIYSLPEAYTDVKKLKDLFTWLKFKVKIFKNLTTHDMHKTLTTFASKNHEEFDCFICCILSPTSNEGLVGLDGKTLHFKQIKDLYNKANCPSLGQKPKLFFLQYCKRNSKCKGSCGSEVRVTGGQTRSTGLVDGDFFIGYPAVGKKLSIVSV